MAINIIEMDIDDQEIQPKSNSFATASIIDTSSNLSMHGPNDYKRQKINNAGKYNHLHLQSKPNDTIITQIVDSSANTIFPTKSSNILNSFISSSKTNTTNIKNNTHTTNNIDIRHIYKTSCNKYIIISETDSILTTPNIGRGRPKKKF